LESLVACQFRHDRSVIENLALRQQIATLASERATAAILELGVSQTLRAALAREEEQLRVLLRHANVLHGVRGSGASLA